MSKKFADINGHFSIQHRAECNSCNFEGSWHADINNAYQDASDHRRQPGNRLHIINIVTQQSSAKRFVDVDD
jgi:hypothetical protein